jgi:hypothetical protein
MPIGIVTQQFFTVTNSVSLLDFETLIASLILKINT